MTNEGEMRSGVVALEHEAEETYVQNRNVHEGLEVFYFKAELLVQMFNDF